LKFVKSACTISAGKDKIKGINLYTPKNVLA